MDLTAMQEAVHALAVRNGFWEKPNLGEKLALIHSEVSELLECYRKGNAPEPSDHRGLHLTQEEEELADIMIRVMDLAEQRGVLLSAAIAAKHAYNLTRPFKHGKQF